MSDAGRAIAALRDSGCVAPDWIGMVTTAIVGMAGIAGTVWVRTSDRRDQRHRALIDEERRTCAKLFAHADRSAGASRHAWSIRGRHGDDSAALPCRPALWKRTRRVPRRRTRLGSVSAWR